jgi:hypothetical protein
LRETSPVDFSAFPTKALREIPKIKKVGDANGASLSQLFPGASRFLQFFFSARLESCRSKRQILAEDHCNHALTKFFVLSNIRLVSWGSAEMLRASRCFRITLLQSDGPRTLAADAPFPQFLSLRPDNFFCDGKAVKSFSSAALAFRSKTRFRNTADLAVGKCLIGPMLNSGNT